MATFTGAGIEPDVQQRILNFLNSAVSAVDIAGIEPQEGPVYDDPTKGYGDQVKDYDIGLVVAQRILDKRTTLGTSGFTDLSQLSNIKGLGQDKFDDLVYSFGPALYGEWETLTDSPVYVVHAAVLNSGKVLMFAGKAEAGYPLDSAVWDPKKQGQPDEYDIQVAGQPGSYDDDLFCSHHSFLADGRLLVNGGDEHPNGHTLKTTYEFDPNNDKNEWKNLNHDMNQARWYPTTLTLPVNEGVITFSGHKKILTFDVGGVPEVEKYDLQQWVEVPNANKALRIFPGMHLMPDGKIFYTGTRWGWTKNRWQPSNDEQTALYDLKANNNQWSNVGHHVIRDRTEGMSVVLPPDNKRVLVIGGRGDSPTNDNLSTNSVEMINFNDSNPAWKEVKKMNYKRRNVNAVLLPTGKVLVCAGIEGYKGDSNPKPVLAAEEYDPDNDKWTELAAMKEARQYHSVSLLLPDGRVLNLGSVGSGGTQGRALIKDMEVFSPPYLFRGARPKITSAPQTVHQGANFSVETPDAASIKDVVLVRPMACTHHTDTEQRVIPLKKTSGGTNLLNVTAPEGAHPHYNSVRGYYMLFILNDKHVPSVAEFIFIH